MRRVSRNYTTPSYALKCDVKKFFNHIDHAILLQLLRQRIEDDKVLDLLSRIIKSFEVGPGKGLPLGNLTSQLLVNIYLDPFDKFVKHRLKAKYYLRYADDFMVLGSDPSELLGYFVEINQFLQNDLKLSIHPNKIQLRKLRWGIDFVGYVVLPHYALPRRKTVKRIFKRVKRLQAQSPEKLVRSLPSYLGYLEHVDAYELSSRLEDEILDADDEAKENPDVDDVEG